jgi:hypothetical protein
MQSPAHKEKKRPLHGVAKSWLLTSLDQRVKLYMSGKVLGEGGLSEKGRCFG